MAETKPITLPVRHPIADKNGTLTADWERAFKLLEAEIKSLRARIQAMETI